MDKQEDIFRPRSGPAQVIYDAFQAEAALRKGRSFQEWSTAETRAVLEASVMVARRDGLPEPDMQDVERAEVTASGHVDYALKWACGMVEVMHKRQRAQREQRG